MQLATVFFSMASVTALLLSGATARADTILAGTQYWQTLGGVFDLGPGFGVVPIVGVPFGPGNTSIQIVRLADATLTGSTSATVPVEMVALERQSTSPVSVNGDLYNVAIHLTPGTRSLGTETITETNPVSAPFQGFFVIDILPHVTADFTPLGTEAPFSIPIDFSATSDPAQWRHQPHPGEVIVSGSADPSLDNCHDLASGCPQDFFIDGVLNFSGARAGETINATVTPEPAAQFLTGTALLALALLVRRNFIQSQNRRAVQFAHANNRKKARHQND